MMFGRQVYLTFLFKKKYGNWNRITEKITYKNRKSLHKGEEN